MSDYKADLRDIRFVLFEHLDMERILGYAPYKDFDREDFDILLAEAAKVAENTLAPLNKLCDQKGVGFEDNKVSFPEEVHAAYKEFTKGDWLGISSNPEFGGQGLPKPIGLAANEMFCAACLTFIFTPTLTVAGAHLVENHGTDEMKKLYVEKMYTGKWAGTMCLTESGAGSAVGDLRTAAEKDGDHYKISGVKTFITSADHDLTENIVHLVLARVKGAPAGMKGVSLFLVPKYRVNPDGSLGDFNDIVVTNLEHKMGIKGSPTCEVTFGDNDGCWGWLIGNEGAGIKAMFQMMNEARIGVGLQGMALSAAAYHTALEYARERIQGVDVTQMRNVDAERVPIVKHPDVARMLLTQKVYTEGMRALLFKTAYYVDVAEHDGDEAEVQKCRGLIELLTPICKAYCSDVGFENTIRAIQVLGGYGYCSEYPVEQYARDCKIASIYEGTNGIQALDLLGRKIAAKGGMLFMSFVMEMNNFIGANKEHAVLGRYVGLLDDAKNALAETVMSFAGYGQSDPLYPIQHATPLLEMFGEVVVGQLLIEQALVAHERLGPIYEKAGAKEDEAKRTLQEENDEARFYAGKLANAAFFATQILPRVRAKATAMASGDRSVLSVVL